MTAIPPFEFKDCAMIVLSTGKFAQNLRELREEISQASTGSLLHHFHETLVRPSFDDPEYSNDFAQWARRSLHDPTLAERLGIVDALDFGHVESLRAHLLELVDRRLAEVPNLMAATPDRGFRFLCSQLIVFTTGQSAATPEELAPRLAALPVGTTFYHFVDARRRNPGNLDDFSLWLARWGEPWSSAGARLKAVGFHHGSLTEMRERIVSCFARTSELQEVH